MWEMRPGLRHFLNRRLCDLAQLLLLVSFPLGVNICARRCRHRRLPAQLQEDDKHGEGAVVPPARSAAHYSRAMERVEMSSPTLMLHRAAFFCLKIDSLTDSSMMMTTMINLSYLAEVLDPCQVEPWQSIMARPSQKYQEETV